MSRVWKFLLSFVIFATICYFGLIWFVDSEVETEFNAAVDGVAGLTVQYGDLAVDIIGQAVVLEDVEAVLPQGQRVAAQRVVIKAFDQIHPVPHFLSATAEGVVLDASEANFGTLASALKCMGYETVSGDVSLTYKFHPDTNTLTLTNLNVHALDMMDVELSASVDRLDLDAVRVEKLVGVRLVQADLELVDRSFVERLVALGAQQTGMAAGQMREMCAVELDVLAEMAAKSKNPEAENVLRGIKRFSQDPGTLSMTIRPEEPVPFLYLFMGRNIYDNLRLLGVTVVTDSSDDI